MSPGGSGFSRQAIGWALLGQVIWLPLVVFAVQERWLSGSQSAASSAHRAGAHGRQPAAPLSLSELEKAAPSPPPGRFTAGLPGGSSALVLPTTAGAPAQAGLVLRGSAAAPSSRQVPADPETKPVPTEAPARRSVAAVPTPTAPQADGSRPGSSPSQLLGGVLALQDLLDVRSRAMSLSIPGAGATPEGSSPTPHRLDAPSLPAPSGGARQQP